MRRGPSQSSDDKMTTMIDDACSLPSTGITNQWNVPIPQHRRDPIQEAVSNIRVENIDGPPFYYNIRGM